MSTRYKVVVTRITKEEKEYRESPPVADVVNEQGGGPEHNYAPRTTWVEEHQTAVLTAEVDDLSLLALSALLYPPPAPVVKRAHRRKAEVKE